MVFRLFIDGHLLIPTGRCFKIVCCRISSLLFSLDKVMLSLKRYNLISTTYVNATLMPFIFQFVCFFVFRNSIPILFSIIFKGKT